MTVARMIISGERRATPMMLPSLLISILYQDLIPQDSRWVRMSRKKKTDKSLASVNRATVLLKSKIMHYWAQ